ncbi:MAG: adenosine kinase [Pseudomonadota bacterium]
MATPQFDILGIGNAIVDVLVAVDDSVLAQHALNKGSMALVDAATATAMLAAVPAGVECSGGSAANTLVGLAALGVRTAYIGKVASDRLGGVFSKGMVDVGVAFDTPAGPAEPPTAQCLVLVTPDAQRTMQTFLGACVELGPDDVPEALVQDAAITYLEGYLWDRPAAKDAFRKAAKVAHAAGRRVSLTLSDPFCVGRHRAEFLDLAENHVDILFANEAELISLYEAESFDAALARVPRSAGKITVVTRGALGSVVIDATSTTAVPAEPIAKVVDTTGAGDLYAAGFLYGLTRGLDMRGCARAGGIAAAEAISHFGARPQAPLLPLVESALAAKA